ncbi:hypothetical protein VE03_02033 [Pseudogymnoascus sp. 23342-1-I1]|nr:hypothetical protein VE03_02033 [Pseudogymnoascus sp. 23342-1-I1]
MISLPKLFTAALAATSVVIAAATPQQVSDGLKSLTQKAQALQAPAQSISIVNAPLILIGQGPFPQIIAGYSDIISTGNALAEQIGAESRMVRRRQVTRGAADDLVFDAYKEFVRVNQDLLNILIGKAGLVEQIPLVGQPIAAVLRSFEGTADTISTALINTFVARANDFTSEANSLGGTLTIAIEKYGSLPL